MQELEAQAAYAEQIDLALTSAFSSMSGRMGTMLGYDIGGASLGDVSLLPTGDNVEVPVETDDSLESAETPADSHPVDDESQDDDEDSTPRKASKRGGKKA
jgi:hypothetical protein